MQPPSRRVTAPQDRKAPSMTSTRRQYGVARNPARPIAAREFDRRACAAFVAATEQDQLGAREQLRRELRAKGYPADQCIRELAAGYPLAVVMRRHGFNPISRQHTADQRRLTSALRAGFIGHTARTATTRRTES